VPPNPYTIKASLGPALRYILANRPMSKIRTNAHRPAITIIHLSASLRSRPFAREVRVDGLLLNCQFSAPSGQCIHCPLFTAHCSPRSLFRAGVPAALGKDLRQQSQQENPHQDAMSIISTVVFVMRFPVLSAGPNGTVPSPSVLVPQSLVPQSLVPIPCFQALPPTGAHRQLPFHTGRQTLLLPSESACRLQTAPGWSGARPSARTQLLQCFCANGR